MTPPMSLMLRMYLGNSVHPFCRCAIEEEETIAIPISIDVEFIDLHVAFGQQCHSSSESSQQEEFMELLYIWSCSKNIILLRCSLFTSEKN